MDQAETTQGSDLRDYLAILRVRKWSVILVSLLVVGSALFFSFRQTPIYVTETRVLVKALPTSPTDFYALPPNLETESQVVESAPVAELAAEELNYEGSPVALLSGLDVSFVLDSDVLTIQYESTDPEFAQTAANAFATAYIENRRSQSLEQLETAQEDIEQRIAGVQAELGTLLEELDAANAQGDRELANTLETQRSTLVARLGVLEQRIDDLQPEDAIRTGGGQILESAALPSTPAAPNHVKNGLLGLALGLALGIGVAFLRERLDNRFRGRGDLEKAMEAPVLASVPRYRVKERKAGTRLVLFAEPQSSASEAYRTLRTNVQFIVAQQPTKGILVTSAVPGEGKTATAVHLAVAFAQAGKKTILVSADLRRPTVREYFDDIQTDKGLSTWLAGEHTDVGQVLITSGIENLTIVPSGPVPPNPSELLTSSNLAELITQLQERCDVLIFDSPPVVGLADTRLLASRLGSTVMIIESATTARSVAVQAKRELEGVGGRIVGTVLNNFDPTSSAHYSSYEPYTAYYSYTPNQENGKKRRVKRRDRKRNKKELEKQS